VLSGRDATGSTTRSPSFWLPVFAIASALLLPLPALSASSLHAPERLTSGAADQFLASFDPSGERVVYVTNENATTEIFGAELSVRVPQALFDESADVTWPRVSPDGKKLLYISYRSTATGNVCFRELTARGLEVSERKCFLLGGGAATQAIWSHDSQSILVVSRNGLASETTLQRLSLQGHTAPELLLQRDLSSPALSPDGKWLLYVPVSRQAGAPSASLSGHAGKSLSLARMDRLGDAPRDITFELPGLPGFPAFSPDGKFLYFSQYLNDTNFDGVVDAEDRAVLFRVPFDTTSSDPVDALHPQQLTSADWDCQSPSPAKDRLVATCFSDGSLDVFSLPLEGVIPAQWTRAQVSAELVQNRSDWERLLLMTRLLELDTDPGERAWHLKRLIEMHLRMHEYQSAGFYSGRLEKLAATQTGPEWIEHAGVAQVLHELARHRRSEEAIAQGQLATAVETAARERLGKLEPLRRSPLPTVAALATLVTSELQEALGDVGAAQSLLQGVRIDATTKPVVLHLYESRTRELSDALNDRNAVLAVDRLLSEHPALEEEERMTAAMDYVHDLLRGMTATELAPLLAKARAELPDASSCAFAVALEQTLLPLTHDTQATVEPRVLALFDQNPGFERRRALIREAIARAKATDSEVLWYDLAEKWTTSMDPQHSDRKRAEGLYRKVALERAYVEWSRGDLESAKKYFDLVARHTKSLEAHAGYIDVSLLQGRTDLESEYRARFAATPESPELHFALAYLQARRLASLPNEEVAQRAEEAKEHLRIALRDNPNSVAVHHLWGYLRHEEFLRLDRHSKEAAAIGKRANAHYLIAVDLARDDPRYRAASLNGLAFMHARLDNASVAAQYFSDRERIPFAHPDAELAACLAHARCLLHSDHAQEAAAMADHCIALVESAPSLSRFLPYTLDRSGLYHLVTRDYTTARERYERLQPLVARDRKDDPEGRRNQFVVHLGRAAAEVGDKKGREALIDIDAAEELLHRPGAIAPGQSKYGVKSLATAFTADLLTEDYEALLTGFRARALLLLNDYAGAMPVSLKRLALLERRAVRDGNEDAGADDRRWLALTEANLATEAYSTGDVAGALAHVEAGLRDTDELEKRTYTVVHGVTLALLRDYADLHFEGHVPLASMKLDLPKRLARFYAELCDRPDPKWLEMRKRYGLYLDRLILEGVQVTFAAK
jgi:hypothetical protein